MRLTEPFYAEIIAHTTTRNQKQENTSFAKQNVQYQPTSVGKKRGRPH